MGFDSNRDADIDQGRPRTQRRYRSDSRDWDDRVSEPTYSLPHRRTEQIQRGEGRTSRRKDGSLKSLDTSEGTMPPPPHLARAATDSYRRPRSELVYDYDHESPARRRRSRREASPVYSPRGPAKYHSPYSSHSSASGAARGRDDDEHIEVIVEAGDGSSRHMERRRPSRDEYMDHPRRSYHRRQRRRHYSDDDLGAPRVRSVSPGASPAREVRRADNSESPRKSRHLQSTDIIDSRPPVTGNKPSRRGRKPSSEGHQEDAPRRSRSNRSRATSTSSRILGGIFGGSTRRPASESAPRSVECLVCLGDVSPSRSAKFKCGHSMCNSCLVRSFKLSVNDPQHMPPRCCTKHHIPLKYVDRLFDDAFKKTWNRKFAEYSTKNRIYCPSKKCGEWIKPANITVEEGRKVARCGRCRIKVCGTCNGRWHHSDECPRDEDTLRILAQAQEEGWKRCYKCKSIVELEAGCNHMTCRCGAEFCMICGIKWKGCNCPWFTYDDMDAGVRPPVQVPPAMEDDRGRVIDNPYARDWPPVVARAPPRTYDEEMRLRRTQEQRDEEFARSLDEPGPVDYGRDPWDQPLFHDPGRRDLLPPARTTRVTPPLERGVDYVADVSRARGRQRAGSMERRLADRFSENRQSTRGRANTGPTRPPPEAMPAPMPPHHGASAPRQHPSDGDSYDSPRRRRSERSSPRYYDDDAEVYGSTRSRRRSKREEAPKEAPAPKSSTLAGLNGVKRGMNRVFEWRTFVEPGVPAGEGAAEITEVR